MAPPFSASRELIIDFKEDILCIFPPCIGVFIVPRPVVRIIRMSIDERHRAVLRRDNRRMIKSPIPLEIITNDVTEI